MATMNRLVAPWKTSAHHFFLETLEREVVAEIRTSNSSGYRWSISIGSRNYGYSKTLDSAKVECEKTLLKEGYELLNRNLRAL